MGGHRNNTIRKNIDYAVQPTYHEGQMNKLQAHSPSCQTDSIKRERKLEKNRLREKLSVGRIGEEEERRGGEGEKR